MTGSQKVLRVFGILELLLAVVGAIMAMKSGGAAAWLSVAVSAIAAVLLLIAAADASKIMGAWFFVLISLVLSALDLVLAIVGSKGTLVIVSTVIAVVLNLIVFIAANNVKRQAKK